MKNIANVVLIVLATLLVTPTARAAYRLHAVQTQASASVPVATLPISSSVREHKVHLPGLPHKSGKPKNEGWEGIAALVCGIVGLSMMLPAIPAVIFGAIGMKKKKNHGLAVAGFVMGIIGCVYLLFFVVILLVSLGAFV